MPTTVLVTGATGFVMANVVRHLAQQGHDVIAADLKAPDALLERFLTGLPGAVRFRQVDVTDGAAVLGLVRETRPTRAVHGAAITAIPPEVERARFLDTAEANIQGTLRVLAALAVAGVGRVVAVSSGSVYGRRDTLAPISEDETKDPQALYPMTKWAGDMLARRFAQVHGVDLAVARLASPFGPFERDTGSRPLLSPMAHWATSAVRRERIVVTGDRTYARDSIYVADIASGIAAILLGDRLPHDAYNVGWGHGTTADEALAALARVCPGIEVEWRPDLPSPWVGPGNVARGPLRCERLRQDFGWRPRYDLQSGLAEYVEWLRRHP
ncbi:MAG TPA: NAD-dependent epimerase/dehydratase family protein [Candidatus Methylomirabilis sp.]|nr:NAD-dependent epimerase/dehydratase family protein [Candidatus Methylomirabilis sp.]